MQVPFTICDLKVPIPLWTLKAATGRRHWSLTKMVVAYHCTPLNSWQGGTFADMQSMLSLFWFLHFVEAQSPNFIMQLNWSLVESIHCCITLWMSCCATARTPSCLLYFVQHWADWKTSKRLQNGDLWRHLKDSFETSSLPVQNLALQGQDRLYQWNDHLQPCFPAWVFCCNEQRTMCADITQLVKLQLNLGVSDRIKRLILSRISVALIQSSTAHDLKTCRWWFIRTSQQWCLAHMMILW